ncbi:hypothetical protein TNCV_118821 [Trichonephila clavipes]|nr:hypothetical protein TNCV_118821 [Trichonephila clavipes]
MAPWPRAPVIPQLVDRKTFRDNRWYKNSPYYELTYGAAVYVKVQKQNEVLVNLISSKMMLVPLKAFVLPRLELLGALVAVRLSSRGQEIFRKKKECKTFHWTDSS